MKNPPIGPVSVAKSDRRLTITLGEGLDQSNTDEFVGAARAASAGGRDVAIDCGGLPFLPTAVVQVLVALHRTCRQGGVPFAVEGVHEAVAAYLRLAGLDAVLRA